MTEGFFCCIIIELENAQFGKRKGRLINKCGIELGNVVKSMAGRDKDNLFVVVDIDKDERYIYLVDGDIRKVENPKRKKIKHVELTSYSDQNLTDRITKKRKITNQEVKRFLREI